MMTSLRYFRRSFRYTSGEDDVINMTIALEVLLTDSYAPGIGERLSERTAVLLRGFLKRLACANALEAVYQARNEAVHSGIRTVNVDLPTVREAYIRCLMKMVAHPEPSFRYTRSDDQTGSALRQIEGDRRAFGFGIGRGMFGRKCGHAETET